jgi:hypothetical protein
VDLFLSIRHCSSKSSGKSSAHLTKRKRRRTNLINNYLIEIIRSFEKREHHFLKTINLKSNSFKQTWLEVFFFFHLFHFFFFFVFFSLSLSSLSICDFSRVSNKKNNVIKLIHTHTQWICKKRRVSLCIKL